MNEVKVVNNDGELLTIEEYFSNLRNKKYVAQLPNEDVERLAYVAKTLKAPFKNVEDEVKSRLSDGQEFEHIGLSETTRSTLPADDLKLKQAMLQKYGWDTLEVKSPAQLKKIFGKAIEEDLSKVTVYSTNTRVKYD